MTNVKFGLLSFKHFDHSASMVTFLNETSNVQIMRFLKSNYTFLNRNPQILFILKSLRQDGNLIGCIPLKFLFLFN